LKFAIAIKRLFDIGVAGLILATGSPLLALIGLAIKLEDGGPILFVQDRVGKNGNRFRCYKFRSMVVEAEERGLGGEVAENDDRLTRVGRILRSWTLDEMPQLVNILKGDMSIVGPRPWISKQAEGCPGWARRRFDVKPGLAGWAWIHGRNLVPWEDRLRMDVWYVENWSLWLDAYILARAFILLFQRRGVYGPGGVAKDPSWVTPVGTTDHRTTDY
jgi:lipopolysaccharide/colanic/teichoic acid biosynthesis glycosyltransferase